MCFLWQVWGEGNAIYGEKTEKIKKKGRKCDDFNEYRNKRKEYRFSE